MVPTVVGSRGREGRRDDCGAEPWAAPVGLAGLCEAPDLWTSAKKLPSQGCSSLAKTGSSLTCLAEGDSLLPRAMLCFQILFRDCLKPQKLLRNLLIFLSAPGLIRKHQTHVTRDPSAGSPSWKLAQHFLMHGGSCLLLFTTAFPTKTFASESICVARHIPGMFLQIGQGRRSVGRAAPAWWGWELSHVCFQDSCIHSCPAHHSLPHRLSASHKWPWPRDVDVTRKSKILILPGVLTTKLNFSLKSCPDPILWWYLNKSIVHLMLGLFLTLWV